MNNITGEITRYKFDTVENIFAINLNEVVAVVEDLKEKENG